MDQEVSLMRLMALTGDDRVGHNMNPDISMRPSFIEIFGEKIVCLAKGGECRLNNKYYTLGMNDTKSWTTPIIEVVCPHNCPYREHVHDNHIGECKNVFKPFPHYNKFRGEFESYCKGPIQPEEKKED